MKRFLFLLILLMMMLNICPAFADGTGQMAVDSDMKIIPDAGSATVAALNAGTIVQIGERQGAWYKITSAQGNGWVRMINVRLSGVRQKGESAASGMQALGKASRSNTTVATGIRGLSREDLKSSQEDPRELAKLNQYQVSVQEARSFGAAGNLPSPR
ncbi:MAG: SH3 domain-containing protein [Desulfosalsimonadaceae bacterium]|nr:SH3 domain-containing protein [Desulfosalsimonadaceae bacterium]